MILKKTLQEKKKRTKMLVKRSIRKRVIGKQITQTNYQNKKKKNCLNIYG